MKKPKLSEYALGLDVGTNSIGWSIVEENNGEPIRFVDCGSRVFIRSVEDKTDKPKPKNQKRRRARLSRRVIERRHRRKARLRNYLISKGFLPETLKNNPNPEVELNKLGDPYKLRAKALDKELNPHEFGRAVLHLGTRRGFLSNRKTGFGDLREDPESQEILKIEDETTKSDKDEGAFKKDIKKLCGEIKESGMRTLGEYLKNQDRTRNRGEHHDRRTDRKMYQEELEIIFQKQSALNPELYTKEVKETIEEIIFFQRPVRWDKKTIGNCSLEPNKRRIEHGRLESQQFRYWQDINNLSWYDLETGEVDAKPTLEQKSLIAETLEKTRNLTWTALKKKDLLNLNKKTKFNLEKVEGKNRKGIQGNRTAYEVREIIGDVWDSWDEKIQKQLVEDLISYESKKGLKKRLQNYWKFDLEKAVKLAVLELEEGYGNLSLKAINNILPHLKEGRIYSRESDRKEELGAVQAAGYKEIIKQPDGNDDTLGEIPFIPNPIVTKALYEVRRVVNAIIKEYGKPASIRIEMARDLEMNTKRYQRNKKIQEANTKANEEAEEKYNEIRNANPHLQLRTHISHQDKLKYRLWTESKQQCSYSGKTISLTNLWSADVEIDHILPYSRSLDNSYMNKVVCFAQENQKKGNKSPWEAFGNTEQWEIIENIIKDYPDPKHKRVMTKEMDNIDDFINNQLSDTRYIARETGKYMKTLGCDVSFTKGGATSWLRHQWGLNNILGETGEKNRADHRHHAIDATVIALTNRSLYQKIVRLASYANDDNVSPEHGMEVPSILNNLRDNLTEVVNRMIVSHSTNRKLTGAFHKDKAYGIREENGRKGIVVREHLKDMTDNKRKKIVDPIIREAFETYVNMRGGLETAQRRLGDEPFRHPRIRDVIRRAKVWHSDKTNENIHFYKKNKDGQIIGVFTYRNNHHVEILKNRNNGKYKGVFVTTMEAAKRARILKEPIVNVEHGKDWEFIMSLCINDTVSVEKNGERKFHRVQALEGNNKLILRSHTAATLDNKDERLRNAISKLMTDFKIKKETINALGRRLTPTFSPS